MTRWDKKKTKPSNDFIFNSDASPETPKQSGWPYLRQACTVSLTNPKVMLFFVAFFPLFLTPEASTITLVAIILHVTILSFVYQAGLVLLGNGIALIAFGINLALNNR